MSFRENKVLHHNLFFSSEPYVSTSLNKAKTLTRYEDNRCTSESFPTLLNTFKKSRTKKKKKRPRTTTKNKNFINTCTTLRRSHQISHPRLLACLTHPGPLNCLHYCGTHKRRRTTLRTEQNINTRGFT